jgi:hypothetical protein
LYVNAYFSSLFRTSMWLIHLHLLPLLSIYGALSPTNFILWSKLQYWETVLTLTFWNIKFLYIILKRPVLIQNTPFLVILIIILEIIKKIT